jgi:hypothetical protein
MGVRVGDTVGFIGPGPDPTPQSANRFDPKGKPRPGDYGVVIDVADTLATVDWRFGAQTTCPVESLSFHPARRKAHRYRVSFRTSIGPDITFFAITEGGEAKAVYMATGKLARVQPEYRAVVVEVEDLGSEYVLDPAADLLAWDEVS